MMFQNPHTAKIVFRAIALAVLVTGLVAACNSPRRSKEAALEAQAARYSAMFAALPGPHEQTLAAKKAGYYLLREARAYYYGRPVPSLPRRSEYSRFTRHIPSFFYSDLRSVAAQAARQQPLLAEASFHGGDAYQLVELDGVNDKAPRMVVLFTVEQTHENPYRYDWALKVAVDVDRWRVLGWEVNRAEPRAGYSSARSQFMGVGGKPRYIRAVLQPGVHLSDLRPGFLGKVYYAELGPSESDTRVYDLEEKKIYRVTSGLHGAGLDLVGTYEDWVPTPPWLRSP